MKIRDLNPAVDKKILILLAGLAWSAVGTLLLTYSVKWLTEYSGSVTYFIVLGIVGGLLVHYFGFSRLAEKNLKRLLPLKDKRCLFSFISWKSYLIIPLMMAMGISLRHSAVPKEYLSVVYTSIGLGLLISGLNYFRHLITPFTTTTNN
jgi:hypothetical protein